MPENADSASSTGTAATRQTLVTFHQYDVPGDPGESRAFLSLCHSCVDRGDVTAAAFWNQQQQQRRGGQKDQVD